MRVCRRDRAFAGGKDGEGPIGTLLLDSAGDLYGTTSLGGGSGNCSYGCGTIFRIAASGKERVLYAFQGRSDGMYPAGNLIADANGDLYGTTSEGGACPQRCGTVYEMQSNGTKSTLYTFQDGSDGGVPSGGVIADASGNLYGMTSEGGTVNSICPLGCGVVFRLASDGTEGVLYAFQGPDGALPVGSLLMDNAGNLYGATEGGGSGGVGTVFKLAPDGIETVLYSFTGASDGGLPEAGLTIDKQGNLYGTTAYGGASGHCHGLGGDGCGVVFEVTPAGAESVLYAFQAKTGRYPEAGLLLGKHGELYGTTTAGGKNGMNCRVAHGCGVVFEVTK